MPLRHFSARVVQLVEALRFYPNGMIRSFPIPLRDLSHVGPSRLRHASKFRRLAEVGVVVVTIAALIAATLLAVFMIEPR